MSRSVEIFKCMGSQNRLTIARLLQEEGEISVGDLNKKVDLSQSALSQHLAAMRRAEVVQTRRQSQVIHYSLVPGTGVEELLKWAAEVDSAESSQ